MKIFSTIYHYHYKLISNYKKINEWTQELMQSDLYKKGKRQVQGGPQSQAPNIKGKDKYN